jgi:hypothetical protein
MTQEELLKKTIENVDFTFNQLDTQRRTGLLELKTFQQAKRNGLEKEKVRLTEKLGPDHPKVTATDAKIRDIDNRAKDLEVLITEANIEVQPIDENTWMVHGKVFDKDRNGIAGLTVALYDENGVWQREIGFRCTGKQGYFAITSTTGLKTQTAASPDKKLFLYISDQNHKILYKDTASLVAKPGQIDYRSIYISDESKECTPPEPGEEKPGPGQEQEQKPPGQEETAPQAEKDQWIVEGKIKDEKNQPVEGVTVSLYDTRHKFDKRLGTMVTDKNGKFTFTYKGEDFKALLEAKADIYLKVTDESGKEVYTSPAAIRCEPGHVDVFDIRLPSKP